jgi:hypothetical protein
MFCTVPTGIVTVGIVWARGSMTRCEAIPKRLGGLSRTTIAIACILATISVTTTIGSDSYNETYSQWEALLWGGRVGNHHTTIVSPVKASPSLSEVHTNQDRKTIHSMVLNSICNIVNNLSAVVMPSMEVKSQEILVHSSHEGHLSAPTTHTQAEESSNRRHREPFEVLSLKNIRPLYLNPRLPGEGIWSSKHMPKGPNGLPAIYHTSYRPSERYPNAVVHMLLFDMRQVAMRLYVGSSEPGASLASSKVGLHQASRLMAITNGLWKRRHSHGAGAIFNGNILEKLAPGMATVVVYKDYSVDILEWDDSIPTSIVLDARQLKHLIVKDGKVINSIIANGHRKDSEIGLGYLLVEDMPVLGRWGPYGPLVLNHTQGDEWFIATRSAFGVRPDGNLVFAAGHHISTKDLAKALVLAGCVRGLHGDANPHNVLGNLYYTNAEGNIVDMAKLSPEQKTTGLRTYITKEYTSDFFAFFKKRHFGNSS